jgi:hypothetical protein
VIPITASKRLIRSVSPMVTRTQDWTLRVVVALVTASFIGNGFYALMVWLRTQAS